MTRFLFLSAGVCLAIPVAALAVPPPIDETVLRQRLSLLPMTGERETTVTLPVDGERTSTFRVRDSRTLPPVLMKKFAGLRSFRGYDEAGRTLRLDLSPSGVRASIRDGAGEWLVRPGGRFSRERSSGVAWAPAPAGSISGRLPATGATAPMRARGGGILHHDFRLAVAATSRYVARTGGTTATALAEIAHAVNRANEVFENDVGVHFTLVDRNDRIVLADASRDPFETHDPGPAAVALIDREIGRRHYDVGQAMTTLTGGESHVGTSCSDARDADFFATHKAAAWSGDAFPESRSDATDWLIHVLARQLGAWPTAAGCRHDTLDDRAMEPGGGSTVMGYALSGCGGPEQRLQVAPDRYLHAASIEQIEAWLASRGGRCAARRITPSTAPWIDPEPLAEATVIPARTPFVLEASASSSTPGRRLSYTWEQMDSGLEQRGSLVDTGDGPLFRSYPPSPGGRRVFPRMAAVLGREPAEPGETLPTTSRQLNFRLTVRDNGADGATTASADRRVRVIDTGKPFAITTPAAGLTQNIGDMLDVRWDVAGTATAPISCHFLIAELSLDGGSHWLPDALAMDLPNNGLARVRLPAGHPTEHARLRLRCDWRPFFAVSPGEFVIRDPSLVSRNVRALQASPTDNGKVLWRHKASTGH